MALPAPPALTGVTHREVLAGGIRFHVAEAGDPDGQPVVLLHGWPQNWYLYRDLLSAPPPGLRLLAPDLPGYGWSSPPHHRWAKEDVATDLFALLDALELGPVLLVGHDWGGWIGYLMALRDPVRIRGFLALNIAHPWQSPRTVLRHVLPILAYQPVMAAFGAFLMRRTPLVARGIRGGMRDPARISGAELEVFAAPFRDQARARVAQDTYRTFLLREMPASARRPEQRRLKVTTRALFGTGDPVIHPSMLAEESALADDYRVTLVDDAGHFIVDERPDLVREALTELVALGRSAT